MELVDEVGGDYYDVFYDGGWVKVGIGDVIGYGLESGVLMLMVQLVVCVLQEKGDNDLIVFLDVFNWVVYKNIIWIRFDKYLIFVFVDYENGWVMLLGQYEEVLIICVNGDVECIDIMEFGFFVGFEVDIVFFV